MQNSAKKDFFPPITKVFKLPNDFSFDASKTKQQISIKTKNQVNITNPNIEKNKTRNERTNDKLSKQIINIFETPKSQLRDRSLLNQRIYLNKSNLGINPTKHEEKQKNLRNTSMNMRQNYSPIKSEAKELIKIYKPNSYFRIKSSLKERSTKNSFCNRSTNNNDQKFDQNISFGNSDIFRQALDNQKIEQNINIIGNINYENINLNFTFSKEDMDAIGLKDLKNIENSGLKNLCAGVLEKECKNFKRKGKEEAKKITFVKETDHFFISFDDHDFNEVIDENTQIIDPEINNILRQTPNFEAMEKYMKDLKFQPSQDPSISNNDNKQTTISENNSNIFSNEFLFTNQDSEDSISLTNNISKILKMELPPKKFLDKKESPSKNIKAPNYQNFPNNSNLIKERRKENIKQKFNKNENNKIKENSNENGKKSDMKRTARNSNENQQKYQEKNCLLIQFDTDDEEEINLNQKEEKKIMKCEKNLISKKIDLIDLNNL